MFENSLLIIKPDYLHKRRPVLLKLLAEGFQLQGNRRIAFSPETAAEFYADYADEKGLPATVRKQCDTFVDGYAVAVLKLLSDVPPKEVCQKLQLCFSVAVTDEVVECGVCHGVSQSLLPFLREKMDEAKDVTPMQMTSLACENLPAKYYKIVRLYISL